MNKASQSDDSGQATDSSPSFNPITAHQTVRPLGFWLRRPAVPHYMALVVDMGRKGIVRFAPGQIPRVGELLYAGIHDIYHVDLSSRRISIQMELPSVDEAFIFQAEIDIEWRVQDAARVVRRRVTDVRQVLLPALASSLREVACHYAIDAVASAEDAANGMLRDLLVGDEFGLYATASVRLSLDTATQYHLLSRVVRAEDPDLLALRLAESPDDTAAVIRVLTEHRHHDRQSVIDFMNRLIESDALDQWKIDDQVRSVLDQLKQHTDLVLRPDQSSIPVIVYLSNGTIHNQVESAIQQLLAAADLEVHHRDAPVSGGRLDG